jgi:hypothetical protein
VLLIAATITSWLAALAFVGYALLPMFANGPRSHFTGPYVVGLGSLAVAEVCQIIFLLVLIAQWFSPSNPQKKVREVVVLTVALVFPPLLWVMMLITLVVYLSARRQDRASRRTQEAREQFQGVRIDARIHHGPQWAQDLANLAAPPSAGASSAAGPTSGVSSPGLALAPSAAPATAPAAPTGPVAGAGAYPVVPAPGVIPGPGAAPSPAPYPGAGMYPSAPYRGATPYPGSAPYLGAPAPTSLSPGTGSYPGAAYPGAGAYPAPAARSTVGQPRFKDAVRQVFGPSTGKSLSETANGVVAIAMVAVVCSAIASAGVVIPSKVLAPLHANSSPSSSTSTSTPGGSSQISLVGTWTLDLHNCSTCGQQPDEIYTMPIQLTGNKLSANSTVGGCVPVNPDDHSCSLKLGGGVNGTTVEWVGGYHGNSYGCSVVLHGTIASAHQMGGQTRFEYCLGAPNPSYTDGTWTATRGTSAVTPTASATGGSSASHWTMQIQSCPTCTSADFDDMVLQTTGTQIAVTLTAQGGLGNPVNLTGSITGSNIEFGGTVAENGGTCTVDFTGTFTSSTEMSGTATSTCIPGATLPGGTVGWGATRT